MLFIKIVVIFIIIVFSFLIFITALKSRRPISLIFFNFVLGFITLLIISKIQNIIGINFTINPITMITSSFFGIPGVILILFLNFFILV